MIMDVFGSSKEDCIDCVDIGGTIAFLDFSADTEINYLFDFSEGFS